MTPEPIRSFALLTRISPRLLEDGTGQRSVRDRISACYQYKRDRSHWIERSDHSGPGRVQAQHRRNGTAGTMS
ncbi:hypothetical protein AFLA_009985 [Aspergillus flavus NRRL3357]|nr:hypothetical protein AFLA_009985 [Aspergillus flavus NRRL3357]